MEGEGTLFQFGVNLGAWIKARRAALGLTQEQLASRDKTGYIDSNWVAQIESGRRKSLPEGPHLRAIASALDSNLMEVLTGAGVFAYSDQLERERTSAREAAADKVRDLAMRIDWEDPSRLRTIETLINMWSEDDRREREGKR